MISMVPPQQVHPVSSPGDSRVSRPLFQDAAQVAAAVEDPKHLHHLAPEAVEEHIAPHRRGGERISSRARPSSGMRPNARHFRSTRAANRSAAGGLFDSSSSRIASRSA